MCLHQIITPEELLSKNKRLSLGILPAIKKLDNKNFLKAKAIIFYFANYLGGPKSLVFKDQLLSIKKRNPDELGPKPLSCLFPLAKIHPKIIRYFKTKKIQEFVMEEFRKAGWKMAIISVGNHDYFSFESLNQYYITNSLLVLY